MALPHSKQGNGPYFVYGNIVFNRDYGMKAQGISHLIAHNNSSSFWTKLLGCIL